MIKVLIVEDDSMVAHLNRKFVERIEGFECLDCVKNGKEAWGILKDNVIDLILLDIYMPVMDGIALLDKIREEHMKVDVIILSSAQDSATINQVFRLGVFDYMTKPFDFERFQFSLKLFQTKYERVMSKERMAQTDIDEIRGLKKIGFKEGFNKGIDKMTMNKLKKYLLEQKGYESTQMIGDALNISRVTIRKYLDFLEDMNEVEVTTNYGNIGRPLNLYRMSE